MGYLAVGAIFAVAGTLDALIAGADLSDAFLTGIISGVSAGALAKVGSVLGAKGSKFVGDFAAGLSEVGFTIKVFAHGAIGGLTSVLQGGKFGHGFASGFFTASATSFNNSRHFGPEGFSWKRVAVGAAIGGSASRLSGGKFANGALTGAFSQALNAEMREKESTPTQLSGTGNEMREQFEALSVDQQEALKNWFADNYFEIFEDRILDPGNSIEAVDLAVKSTEAVHFVGHVAKHGFWRATPQGLAYYVGGKALMTIPKAIVRNRVINYKMALRAYDSQVFSGFHTRMATGNYMSIDWGIYNMNGNPTMSVDFYYYVTDQVSVRPPTCVVNESC